jgi:hypothetical protein
MKKEKEIVARKKKLPQWVRNYFLWKNTLNSRPASQKKIRTCLSLALIHKKIINQKHHL